MIARLVLLLATVALLTTSADAGPPPELAARAEAHRARGEALYMTQRYEEALAEFTAGYELLPLPVFLFDIAQVRWQLKDCRAVQAFQRFLIAVEALRPEDPDRIAVEEGIPWARENIATLEPSCREAMALPTRARARRWHERPGVIAILAVGVGVAAGGGGLLYLGEREAQAAHRATRLDDVDRHLDAARVRRIGGGVALGLGLATVVAGYTFHRLRPRLVDEITVEVDRGGAVAALGGRF